MPPRIVHITIFGRDLKRMLAFYRDILGLTVIAADDEFHYASLDGGGGLRIGLGAGEPGPNVKIQIGGLTGIGFGVADVDAAYEDLKAKGVTFTMPPKRQPWGGYMAMFLDPDGNEFYLQPIEAH
jgi:catechol 2,3-dioxygenase-like lactoylglutathione lyase family enzyme